jgi:hypothetical protein
MPIIIIIAANQDVDLLSGLELGLANDLPLDPNLDPLCS